MIIRIYRCTVASGKEAEFREFALSRSHPWLRDQKGLLAFHAGRPLPGSDHRTRCMVQIWESVSAIQAAIGDELDRPLRLPEEAQQLIVSASAEHYDLADEFRAASH